MGDDSEDKEGITVLATIQLGILPENGKCATQCEGKMVKTVQRMQEQNVYYKRDHRTSGFMKK